MTDVLILFSSDLERDAAFPDGIPEGIATGIAGVGLVDASIGTARQIAAHQPEAIIFAGTCGAYRESGLSIEDVLVATEVRLASGDVGRREMRFPTLLQSRLTCDEDLSTLVLGCPFNTGGEGRVKPGTVACTLGVTETDELAAQLHDHDRCDGENLEAFSVLRAAGSIPTAIVLGVTNIVGTGGGSDWRANYRRMMSTVGHLSAAAVRRYRLIQRKVKAE